MLHAGIYSGNTSARMVIITSRRHHLIEVFGQRNSDVLALQTERKLNPLRHFHGNLHGLSSYIGILCVADINGFLVSASISGRRNAFQIDLMTQLGMVEVGLCLIHIVELIDFA